VRPPKKHQFKNYDQRIDHWDNAHPLEVLGTSCVRQRQAPQLRKGSQIAPKGVADLLLEGRGATCGGHAVPARDGTPGKPEFFEKQKMRPNEVLKKPSINL
jgi:hypothetical protein